ncbi:PhnE/PtxC family ABC transporter permease [Megasphaera cerevisiae]|jgi:phosphonate transport system permease protein|nr:ABC transporter permease subunit [Megasphaera cerevisiae]SJZ56116.1 phosphonate transport system permease protein [Megasphaera cerevisiae DSM 20462]
MNIDENEQIVKMPVRPFYRHGGKIDVSVKGESPFIRRFLLGTAVAAIGSLYMLHIDWMQLGARAGSIVTIFGKMVHFNMTDIDFTLISFADTFSIMVLATVYSILSGLLFGLLASENIVRNRAVSMSVKAFFTFLRAVPTPVWVLLMLVCFGFGPIAGIMGLSIHTTAFFTRAFSQAFEDVPQDTIDSLEALGATRLQVIWCGIIPSSVTQLIAWIALRFEINFSECAILGMLGAGGIGFAISTSIQNYQYGQAGIAIFLVFLFAFYLERGFLFVKQSIR